RGNLRERHHDRGSCAGDPVTISEYYQDAEDLGNEHGETNFVVRAEDPRGNLTLASYDQAGNRTSIIHPEPNIREDMQFDANGRLTRQLFPADQHGHRREIVHTYEDQQRRQTTVEDPHGLALTTAHEYDAASNETHRIDARGSDSLYTYNQRDQLIRELGPLDSCAEACGGGDPARSQTDRHYDANGNLVRVEQVARACDGSLLGDGVVATHYEYDLLDELIATRSVVHDGVEIVDEFVLDANREPILIRRGAATSGADPFNTLTTEYDERGLIHREIRGAGSEAMSTTVHHYDLNGNEVAI